MKHKTARELFESPQELEDLFTYDRTTGQLLWAHRPSNPQWSATWAGKEAGTKRPKDGYIWIRIGKVQVAAHRIAYTLATGEVLEEHDIVDHIDGNRTNNRPDNLRKVTHAENSMNRAEHRGKKNVGVYPTPSGKYRARLRNKHLGCFDTEEAAIEARRKALNP